MALSNTMASKRSIARVLVVDDERVIAETLALILEQRGYDARAAFSGEEAAAVAQEWKPDAVITDVMMEKMNGVVLAVHLAKVLPYCKVLLVSANKDAAEFIRATHGGGHNFPIFAKPFDPDIILDFVGAPRHGGRVA